jgi:hypothetical protein
MAATSPKFPFYVPTEHRALTAVERALVQHLVERDAPDYLSH